MIEVRSLSKKFGDVWAVKSNSWQLKNNRALGLLGPNGAGKSTTMKMITGLLCPSEGSVLVDGEDIFKSPIRAKKKIGFLPETPPVYEELRVNSYLSFVAGLKSVPSSQRKARVEDVIEKVNLQEVAYKYIGQLSKGFRQRVGIAQALVNNPPIVILDEPSVGLDPQQVYELRNLIKSLKDNHTVILSTHVLSEVEHICDDVVIIDRGEIKAVGAIEEIISQIKGQHGVKFYLHNLKDDFVSDIKKLPNVAEVKVNKEEASVEVFSTEPFSQLDDYLQIALKYNCGILDIEKYQTHLEEAFIQITGKKENG